MNICNHCHIRNLIFSKKLSTFHYNEHLVAVDHKQRKRLFKLKINGQFEGRTGRIRHEDIAGLPPSWPFTTHIGSPVTLRRPSLEEYVKLMHRSANIMYPKDIWALIGMLDIGPGSKVIEAGTGSGALTLHLSRAVGLSGKVMSFEVRKGHLDAAMTNCREWDNCLRYRGDQQLLDNIEFHNGNLKEADQVIKGQVDAVALDLAEPPSVMDSVSCVLKPNGACVLYLPKCLVYGLLECAKIHTNLSRKLAAPYSIKTDGKSCVAMADCVGVSISQVIQLSNYIRKSCLPLFWDTVEEVVHREWTVKPAFLKKRHAYLHTNLENNNNPLQGKPSYSCREVEGQMLSLGADSSGDGCVESVNESCSKSSKHVSDDLSRDSDEDNYIARPSHYQKPHTAFLVKLRKNV